MHLSPLYEGDEFAPDELVITNVARILRDEEYQTEALARYGRDMALEPYVQVSESAVWREDQSTPALLIKDVMTDGLVDTGQDIRGTLRFSCYHALAMPDGEEATDELMREAYRRNRAVEVMLRRAPLSEVFKDLKVGGRGKVFVTRKDPSDTMAGKASYYRFPSVNVEVRFSEGV